MGIRDEEFERAHREADALFEASGALAGGVSSEASRNDDLIVLLRVIGPGKARQCGHLTDPVPVHVHSAIGIHQCEACSSSAETRARVDDYRPSLCDSCGERAQVFTVMETLIDNIILTAFVCDECREGRRTAVLPEWARRLADGDG